MMSVTFRSSCCCAGSCSACRIFVRLTPIPFQTGIGCLGRCRFDLGGELAPRPCRSRQETASPSSGSRTGLSCSKTSKISAKLRSAVAVRNASIVDSRPSPPTCKTWITPVFTAHDFLTESVSDTSVRQRSSISFGRPSILLIGTHRRQSRSAGPRPSDWRSLSPVNLRGRFGERREYYARAP